MNKRSRNTRNPRQIYQYILRNYNCAQENMLYLQSLRLLQLDGWRIQR
ncbi:unnamed protein product [Paramecium sonneborni]|uniref:Uncharacterized protein n=1 Tax=Paramecium sonneborni TaxID=65129 RepID=A0A8S1PD11_9CILI|nr:unnamed protein product [Paramecium sonneborni]